MGRLKSSRKTNFDTKFSNPRQPVILVKHPQKKLPRNKDFRKVIPLTNIQRVFIPNDKVREIPSGIIRNCL